MFMCLSFFIAVNSFQKRVILQRRIIYLRIVYQIQG